MTFRTLISFVLSYALVISPVWAQNASQPTNLSQFFKETHMSDSKTVAEWLKKNKQHMHPKVAELVHQWSVLNPNVKMPKIHVSSFKNNKGEDVTRITYNDKGKNVLADFVTSGSNIYLLYEGKKYTYNDIYYDGHLEGRVNSPLASSNEYRNALKAGPAAVQNYQANTKKLVMALEKLDRGFDKPARKTSFVDLFLETANAIPPGSSCIVGGHVSTVAKGSCGAGDANVVRGCQTGTEVACNPLVYGYSGEKELCVPNKPATQVSVKCDQLYPVPGKARELAESVAAVHTLHGLGMQSQQTDKFYQDLNQEIQSAAKVCMNEGFNYGDFADKVKAGTAPKYTAEDFASKFPDSKDEHHRIACATVMNRLFFAVAGRECVIDTNAAEGNGEKPCPPQTNACQISEKGAVTDIVTLDPVIVKAPRPEKEEKKKKSILPWILGGIGVLGILCLAKVICKDKDKKPKPTPTLPPTPTTLPPMPVGKPGENGTNRPGQGGVGAAPPITLPVTPVTNGGPVVPRGGTK